MKKNRICALLALLMLLTLAACGKKGQQSAATPIPSPAVSASATAAAQSPSLTVAPTPGLTPRPTRTPAPEATPMPLATAAPAADVQATPAAMAAARANAPVVTKQPNGEAHYIGESAIFIAAATNWTSLSWTAVSPSGREIDMKTFRETFPDCSVLGEGETTLTVTNLNIDMSGWSFYCTFENENAKTKTESARLRVRDPDNPTGTTTGSATAVTTKSKRLRCPYCGSEVPRDLLNCPYCGAGIYTANEYGYVEQDSSGDIFYMDNTGAMYFDSSDRTSTYVDTNTNYAIFNDAGAVQFGNYNKEQQEAEEQAQLMALLGDLGY